MKADTQFPLTSTHWGTYRVETADGRVTGLRNFEEDGDPSPIGHGIVDVIDAPSRIKQPAVRQSWLEHGPGAATERRGSEPFVAVSWDEAEKLVATELDRVRTQYGNQAIFAGSYGWASAGRFHHAQSQLKRFLNCIGGFTASANSYSFAAAEVVVPHVLGNYRGHFYDATAWQHIASNTQLFVAFGGVPLKNGQISAGGGGQHIQRESLLGAHAKGCEFVNISPLRSDLPTEVTDQWLAIRPCSDTALMLALCHTLLDEGLEDRGFLDRYTEGFDRFANYLRGGDDGPTRSADWAAPICELPADEIRTLARRMAKSRTMISVSWSLTRQDHGEQSYWAAIVLAAMLGQIGLPGGGIGFGYSAVNSIGNGLPSLPHGALPQGRNPVPDFIPVARISDMLLNPGGRFDYDGQNLTYPDIRLVWWAGGNPFHHHQDLNRLRRAWARPDTVIANEWCWNALARHADIVLPCTTTLERRDIALTPRDGFVVSMEPAIAPIGQARDDHTIFRGLARRLGVEDAFCEGRDAEDWQRWIYDTTKQAMAREDITFPNYETFRDMGWFQIETTGEPTIMMQDFRKDPVANPLATPSGRIEIYSDVIAGFGYDDCPGHPVWREPVEWLGTAQAVYPLHLLSNQPKTKLHSQLDHGSHSRAAKIDGREPVTMNPADASARGIADADVVRLFNDRGACLAAAVLSDDIRVGVVQLATGAWYDPEDTSGDSLCKHGNPNVLTRDQGTSRLGQGPVAHSCLVEIEKYKDIPPQVTAFDPPVILKRKE